MDKQGDIVSLNLDEQNEFLNKRFEVSKKNRAKGGWRSKEYVKTIV